MSTPPAIVQTPCSSVQQRTEVSESVVPVVVYELPLIGRYEVEKHGGGASKSESSVSTALQRRLPLSDQWQRAPQFERQRAEHRRQREGSGLRRGGLRQRPLQGSPGISGPLGRRARGGQAGQEPAAAGSPRLLVLNPLLMVPESH